MTAVKVTSVLAKLIDAIEIARMCESEEWRNSKYFKAIESCLEDAHVLLHFELTRQQENKLTVSPDVNPREVTRQSEATQSNAKTISLPDEVLSVIFSYFKDSLHNPTNLSSNAYNFALVCKSWFRVANRRLWQNVHLLNRKSTILFARSLYEQHDRSSTPEKGSPLSISDGILGLHVHLGADISCNPPFIYVFDCVNLFTKNIVSLNLKGLSTADSRPMKLTEFYVIIKFHPFLKNVWLDKIDLDAVEPLDPVPQLETCECPIWSGPDDVEKLELISAKTIRVAEINVFKKDAVKSVYCDYLSLFQLQVHEYKKLTHLHLRRFEDEGEENDLVESFSHIVKIPHLSFLILGNLTYLTSNSFDLIAEHCSLTAFVIGWQPRQESVDSWINLIKTLGCKLLSIGVGLEGNMYLDHPNIFQAIYQNCPNLTTLELYGNNIASDSWPLQLYASELENLCHLPLKWIYAPWFQKWPQNWKDSCPKFAKLCRLGLNVGLEDFTLCDHQLLDYNQPMRPAIIWDGCCVEHDERYF